MPKLNRLAPSTPRLSSGVAALAAAVVLAAAPEVAVGQSLQTGGAAAARAGAIAHLQEMQRLFPDPDHNAQATPPVIPQLQIDPDPGGAIATFQPRGPTVTAQSPFFQNLGTNGRTCFTCHRPEDGWSISAQHAQDRFAANVHDPLFRLVDGATCPSDDVSTRGKKRKAYRLLLEKGLIRIGLPMPSSGLEFQIINVNDPYGCNTNQATGLTGSSSGTVSVYRRPLPATNLGFLNTIMWDGREPSLFHQAMDATLGHAQAAVAPTPEQQQQIVTFEGCTTAADPALCAQTPAGAGIVTAQIFDDAGQFLFGDGATGGPVRLSRQMAKFFIGINDPFGQNPTGKPFNPEIFNLYDSWGTLHRQGPKSQRRHSIARGEACSTAPGSISPEWPG